MLSNQIKHICETIKSGESSAPLLVTEYQAGEILSWLFSRDLTQIESQINFTHPDYLLYDCADKKNGNHSVKKVREFKDSCYRKPSFDILVVLFRDIDALDASSMQSSENTLLHFFEEVPKSVLVLVTSREPHKIISTLLSRMILIADTETLDVENPHQRAIDEYVKGNAEPIFSMTLGPGGEGGFNREDALWIVRGLQEAIQCGTLSTKHAESVKKAYITLETANTSPKYIIDQLLIHILGEK